MTSRVSCSAVTACNMMTCHAECDVLIVCDVMSHVGCCVQTECDVTSRVRCGF